MSSYFIRHLTPAADEDHAQSDDAEVIFAASISWYTEVRHIPTLTVLILTFPTMRP